MQKTHRKHNSPSIQFLQTHKVGLTASIYPINGNTARDNTQLHITAHPRSMPPNHGLAKQNHY
jgi:hypothetical protein